MAVFTSTPETFFVEEIPAYLPNGEGTHTFVWIEKRGLTTPEAVRRLARGLRVAERDIGYAGLKDRHATTRQWLSLPGVDPAAALAWPAGADADAEAGGAGGSLRVLEARRHGNKLRVGHLKGNRFEVVLTEVGPGEAGVLEARLAALGREGLSNAYGGQRFGARGDNVAVGLAILRGQRRERDPRRRRLFLSAVQSEVFNRVLARRAAAGGLRRVRPGDVLQKTATGGLFVTDDLARDQARVDAGEVVPTAPMLGSGTRDAQPPEGTEAHALEEEALAAVGVTRAELGSAGRDLPGARRPVLVTVTLGDPPIAPEDAAAGAAVRLRFSLPPGSYATVLLEALASWPPDPGGVSNPVLTFRVPASSSPASS